VIRGIGSPRYICFNDSVAYVTSLYEPRIAVVDVATAAVADYIETPDHTSTEQMAIWGDTLYVSCWSYDDAVLMVDLTSGEVAGEIGVRSQPRQIALDGDGRLWVLTDGGYGEGSSPKPPALYRIDAASGSIEREFVFRMGDTPRGLAVGAGGDTVYFLNGDVWRMDTDAEELPREPFIPASNTIYYALGVDPRRGDIYVGDAIDYQQQGVVYRFSADGRGLDTLRVGIIPTDFCFR
jgi:streptogramin lyase